MKPLGLNEAGFVKHAKKTRKAPFLAEMNEVEPWSRRVAAWEHARNADSRPLNWRFTTPDARLKLKRLYPSIQDG